MLKTLRPRATTVYLLASVILAACGPRDGKPDSAKETGASDEAVTTSDSAAPEPAAGPAENPISAPLTAADIARWEKGIDGELKAVREAGAKLKTARTNEDTLNAMMGVQEMSTTEAGAAAAGLDLERYKFVRSNFSAVVGYLTPSLGGIDTTNLTQEQRDELRQGNEAQLQRMQSEVPPEVVEALRPRAAELRKKDMELIGERLKGAGVR